MANIIIFNPNKCLECTMYFKIFIVGLSYVEVMFIYRISIGMPVMDMNLSSVFRDLYYSLKSYWMKFKLYIVYLLELSRTFEFTDKILWSCCNIMKNVSMLFGRANGYLVVLVGRFGSQVPRWRPCKFAKLNVADCYNIPLCRLRWHSPQHLLRPWHYPHLRYGGMYDNRRALWVHFKFQTLIRITSSIKLFDTGPARRICCQFILYLLCLKNKVRSVKVSHFMC